MAYLVEGRVFPGHSPHANSTANARQLRVVRGEQGPLVEGGPASATGVVLPVAADHRLVFPDLKLIC